MVCLEKKNSWTHAKMNISEKTRYVSELKLYVRDKVRVLRFSPFQAINNQHLIKIHCLKTLNSEFIELNNAEDVLT